MGSSPLPRRVNPRPAPPKPEELLLVALGAIPGALLRWLLQSDPVANLVGCLLIGIASGFKPPTPRLLLFLGIGFCGSLTTFSAWILSLSTAISKGSLFATSSLLFELGYGILMVRLGNYICRWSNLSNRDQ
jgi:CrcB protein